MKTLKVSLATSTPVLIGQWLTLDAILDGVLERDGIDAKDRVLPLATWNGRKIGGGMTAMDAAKKGAVFVASACIPRATKVVAGIKLDDEINFPHITLHRPKVRTQTFRGGDRTIDYDTEIPYRNGRKNTVDTQRGLTATMMSQRKSVDPGYFDWFVQGDADAIIEILDGATGIGGKVSAGFGWIIKGSVEITPLDTTTDERPVGVFDETGCRLLRPVPDAFLTGQSGVAAQMAMQTVRSPYWDRSGVEPAYVPVAAHHAGILSPF